MTFDAVDMDAHVIEPWDLWERYIDKPYRRNAPRGVADSWGMRRLMVESRLYPTPEGRGRAPRRVFTPEEQQMHNRRLAISEDPKARLEMMKEFGIARAVLLPSQGFFIGSVQDPDLAAAVARAYNTWLAEFCSVDPERLLGTTLIPLQNVPAAVAEIRRAAEHLKFKTIYVRPNPVHGRTLLDPAFRPVMEVCQSYGLSLLVHEGCGFAPGETVGIDRFENGLFSHVISHPMEQMLGMLAIISGGVLERFPKLRVAFLEAGCGWVPYWLKRMDDHAAMLSWEVPWLSMAPSAYFKRQCVVSCDPDEECVDWVMDAVGDGNVVMLTDFPHADYMDASHVDEFPCLKLLCPSRKAQVLSRNAEWFLKAQV